MTTSRRHPAMPIAEFNGIMPPFRLPASMIQAASFFKNVQRITVMRSARVSATFPI